MALEASGDNDSIRISGTLVLPSRGSFGVSEARATATKNIVIQSNTTIAQTEGVVSIVDGLICIGNGSDADYALASARLARLMLLQETSTSLLAKSNGLSEVVLDLLKDK